MSEAGEDVLRRRLVVQQAAIEEGEREQAYRRTERAGILESLARLGVPRDELAAITTDGGRLQGLGVKAVDLARLTFRRERGLAGGGLRPGPHTERSWSMRTECVRCGMSASRVSLDAEGFCPDCAEGSE